MKRRGKLVGLLLSLLLISILLYLFIRYSGGSLPTDRRNAATVTTAAHSVPHPFSGMVAAHLHHRQKPLLALFIEALVAGLLAVFTPYVYAILPVTISYISIISGGRKHAVRNSFFYAVSLTGIFCFIGLIISILLATTGIYTLTDHWLLSLIFCRVFIMLGLSFLGAFEINLPVRLAHKLDAKAGIDNFKSIFFMALSLLVVTISSTGPIVGLVLIIAGKGGAFGPIVGMFGFSIGFVLPFIFPAIINIVSRSITWLNHIKVLLGFFSILLGIKFLSNADISLGWNLIDDNLFIILWMALASLMGIYMLGFVRLSNDYLYKQNDFGQEYVSISRLLLAIAFFSFAIYLLPGLWGAPLHQVRGFLPQIH